MIDTSKLTRTSNQHRRSIYVLARRNYHLSQLDVFDQPVLPLNCTKRNTSAVVQQSLNMLNSEFILDQAGILADRVIRQAASGSQSDRIGRVFQLAFSRQPAAEELGWCRDFLGNQAERLTAAGEQAAAAEQGALVNLCQMLLNTNEFLYVR